MYTKDNCNNNSIDSMMSGSQNTYDY